MKYFLLITFFISFLLSRSLAEQEAAVWYTDYEKALEVAAKEEKNVLISFSGTYFAPKSMVLKKDVYGSSRFIEQAQENYILLAVEKPSELDANRSYSTAVLFRRFGVNNVPSVVLCQPDGAAYTRFRADTIYSAEEMLDKIDPAKVKRRPINRPFKTRKK